MRRWILAGIALCLLLCLCGCAGSDEWKADYDRAQALYQAGDYTAAEEAFLVLGNYRDSKYMLSEIKMANAYESAVDLLAQGEYSQAYVALCELGDYRDAAQLLERFRIVELTADNWDTYFEIEQALYLDPTSLNSEGIYIRMQMQHAFRLKEEYRARVYMADQSELVVQFIADGITTKIDIDQTTGEYTVSPPEEFVNPTNKAVTAKLEDVTQEHVFLKENIAKQTDMVGTLEFYFYTWWHSFHAQTTEGNLYLYEE